ncbi:hydantoinase B/oxoprolinase family protein [Paraburkholderia unamae]|uniref:N-methylhydantoinase B n=1 Tax=Paraburkholderia unamae TaxID=219649 RepID=A0ABX5KIG0_9BURK|nr:hydantoinase B/oxoprolinase family protein [Paraburkholderia unamae]PVX80091.1 N-methylhydantoinase B [Paraburkholderia unamae]CAG9268551.1 N-methylhydantoinase B [Paraburkholderia unamae]
MQITVDPITVEVIGSALTSIVEEMGEALVRASYSTNIKERRDCSTAIFDRNGQALCQAEHIPMHLGSFIGVIPHILKRNAVEDIRPGDIFIANDAYEGGATHLPDIVIAEPIFFDGKIVSWAVNTAHHADFADRGHAHIYQEGLRIPPIRLYREGVLQKDVQELILLNCQVPHERISDLRAQCSANRLCVERMEALYRKYGAQQVVATGDALQDYAERKMRAGIARIPDGRYRFTDRYDGVQFDGEMTLGVEIEVRGDEMRLHFESPAQVRAGMNVTYTGLLATVYYAVKSIVDPSILPNAGLARPITVAAQKGTLLNCTHPAAVDGRIGACQRVVDVINGALAQAVPERVPAAGNGACTVASFTGTRDDGSLWVYLETIGGGSGARPHADGLSGVHVSMTNTSNLPVEALELEYPLTLLRYELVGDSGGAGEFRGGMGLRRVYRIDRDCVVYLEGSRLMSSPWGLHGGEEGGRGRFDFGEPGASLKGSVALKRGQTLDIVTPGAGGYGDPVKRPHDQVQADLAQGRISPETAQRVYRYSV